VILAVNDTCSTAIVRHDPDHGAIGVMHDQLPSIREPADTPKKRVGFPSASGSVTGALHPPSRRRTILMDCWLVRVLSWP
jgi:hypothetical protein